MEPPNHESRIQQSWERNAAAWTTAVREALIASRREGTDDAVVRLCMRRRPKRVLDVGCGEGWLARRLAASVDQVVGIDGSEALISAARAAGDGRFEVVEYKTLERDPARLPGPWDVIVCNFALLGDPLVPLLSALRRRLAPAGRLVIQTVHPDAAGPNKDGWREETFANFGVAFPLPMPWYFRTAESWANVLKQAGIKIEELEEPKNASTGRSLSLLFECRASDT